MKGMTLILKVKALEAQGEMWFEYKQIPPAYGVHVSTQSLAEWCSLVKRWPLENGGLCHWMGRVWF